MSSVAALELVFLFLEGWHVLTAHELYGPVLSARRSLTAFLNVLISFPLVLSPAGRAPAGVSPSLIPAAAEGAD